MLENNWSIFFKGKINGKTTTFKKSLLESNPYFKGTSEKQSTFYKYHLIFKKPMCVEKLYLEIPYEFSDEKVLLNGFQTWSTSRMVSIHEKEKSTRQFMNWLQGGYGDYRFTNYGYLHSWNYTYLAGSKGSIILGSLNEDICFHVFEFHPSKKCIRVILDINNLLIKNTFEAFNLFVKRGHSREILKEYFELLSERYPSPLEKRRYYGWTSWYNYYTEIDEKIILENLEHYHKHEIPIDYFQIDDGYQSALGDWLTINDDFPRGMKIIADKIHQSGYEAGLWLSPFICEKKSNIYKNHPEWLIKDHEGNPVKIGYNPGWSGFYYGLDFTNQEVKNHLKKVFNVIVNQWGYDLLKLDFLFALSFIQSKRKTRGEIFREAMIFLNDISGQAKIIGCGVPLASCYGLFEFCRVSCDIGLKWEDYLMKFMRFKERVSTVNAIETTMTRREMNHHVFINDPDVFLLRESNQKMTIFQRETLYYMNLIFGGLIFTSDNISEYDEGMIKLLKFGMALKKFKITNIKEKEYLAVELSCKDQGYLFLINLTRKKVYLKNIESFMKKYIIKEQHLKKYQSIVIKKCERI